MVATSAQVCIECSARVPNGEGLFHVHGPGNVELLRCVACGQLRDKYVEYDKYLVLLDLLLLSPPAYRHCLFNRFSGAPGRKTDPPAASALAEENQPPYALRDFLARAWLALLLAHACLGMSALLCLDPEGEDIDRGSIWGSKYPHPPLPAHWWMAPMVGAGAYALSVLLLLSVLLGLCSAYPSTTPTPTPRPMETGPNTYPGTLQAQGCRDPGARGEGGRSRTWLLGGREKLSEGGGWSPSIEQAALALLLGDAPKVLSFCMVVWRYPAGLGRVLSGLAATSSFISLNVLLSSCHSQVAAITAAICMSGGKFLFERGVLEILRQSLDHYSN